VTPGSMSRPVTSQPPYLGRKPNARVATSSLERSVLLCLVLYLLEDQNTCHWNVGDNHILKMEIKV